MPLRLPQIAYIWAIWGNVFVFANASLVFDWVGLSLSTAAHGGIKIVLREAGGRRCAGCGLNRPPSLNGMTLLKTDIIDDDYKTITRGSLDA